MKSLKVSNLCIKNEEKFIVKNLNFEIKSGEIVALVGKSGSGKTLSSTALLGFLPKNLTMSGEFYLDDINLKTLKTHKIISYIMQNPSSAFNPIQTIMQHARQTQKANGKKFNKDKIYKLLQDVGLKENVANLYPFEMSGGMLQRAMIMLSMLQEAPFLIADECTSDLDLVVQNVILEILSNLAKKRNIGILLITHDFGVVAKIANRVLVIQNGEIVEQNVVKEIFKNQSHNATKELMNAHLNLYKDEI